MTLSLPVQSVDPDEPLNQRLTQNVLQNFLTRYAEKNSMGEALEDWNDIFRRVAENVAVAEGVHHDMEVQIDADSPAWADWVDVDEDVPGGPPYQLDEDTAPYVCFDGVTEIAVSPIANLIEQTADEFEEKMRRQMWMPNSPTLMNAGTSIQQLSACFVDEPGDSMTDSGDLNRSSILDVAKEAGAIFSSGGGVGYPLHHMRPRGARVSSTGGVSSGPVSFMQIYDAVCGTVKQGGRRRGAQMGIMHIQHPDIGRFVTAKRGEENLTNFNISAGLTNDFLEAVRNDEEFELFDPKEGWTDPELFDLVPETVHFYDPTYEDCWNEEMDKPGEGLDGKVVRKNFWRDYQDEMQDPGAFEEFRDRVELIPGEPMTLPARFIWQMIIDGAHNNGEPGFVHLDNINDEHSFDVEKHEDHLVNSTNPCAEQPLENYEACNLGHLNLSLMVSEGTDTFGEYLQANLPNFEEYEEGLDIVAENYLEEALDTELFDETVKLGTRFLDNVVTMSKFPLEKIEEKVGNLRKVGVGMMGLHQCLLQLGVSYGSNEGRAVAKALTKRIDRVATETSNLLASERGEFPAYQDSKWSDPEAYPEWIQQHGHINPADHPDGYPVRNHNLTTVAPTGSTSMIGDTSGGCEPIFNVAYFKNVSDDIQGDEMLVEFDDYFLRTLEENDVDVDAARKEAEEKMMANEFDGPADLDTVPEKIADVFVTSGQLSGEDHILMQAAIQEYIDSGTSKTLNVSNDTTIEEVGEAIRLATRKGIKGATIFRDGSRQEQVLTTRTDNELDGERTDDQLLEEAADRFTAEELATQLAEHDVDLTTADAGTPVNIGETASVEEGN